MRSRVPRFLARSLTIIVMMAAWPALAQDMDPLYRFRTIRTEHFAIHFHQGAGPMAASLADIAEATWRRFDARPGEPPPAHTHVVLVDQSESPNGFATPLPRNTIVLYAVAPSAASLLNPDDWLRTVFVHEYTHVVHLDRAEGWARLARAVFGRAPWAFPNLMLPLWQIEGLATFEESLPGETDRPGRLHAGDFQAITLEAARAGTVAPIDRANGGLTDWPGGLAPYAWGLSFHVWLAERYGAESFQRLSDATAGSIPWFGARAFSRVYGRRLGDLWADYTKDMEAAAAARDGSPRADSPRRLTRHGFQVAGPRYLPPTCEACPVEIAYSVRTPHDRPGLHVVNPASLEDRRMTTRFLGNTLTAGADARIYFDQQERRRNAGLYSDLYALDRRTGEVTQITSDARLQDPDLSRDGGSIVAVRHAIPGQRDLVLVDLHRDDGTTRGRPVTALASAPRTLFSAPRWSPDGRRVVVSRQQADGRPDLVIVDVETMRVDRLAAASGMRWATPTWRPDGRAVIAAGAQGDAPFDLYEIAVQGDVVRRLTRHAGGATWPDISADGATIVYVGYGLDGFDLYEIPYPPATAIPPLPTTPATNDPRRSGDAGELASGIASAAYRPWSTLLPTSWTPTIATSHEQIRAGAAVGGRDVLGYHAWAASADWPVIDRGTTGVAGDGADWSASYVYGRWQPQSWAAVSRQTSFFPADTDAAGLALSSTLVERASEIGIQLPMRRLRFSQAAQLSLVHAVDTFTHMGIDRRRNRSGTRAAWRFSSAQLPGYAISPERGLTLGTAAEFVAPALGASGRGGTVTGDVRAYVPGPARHHVIAMRVAGGYTWGDTAVGRLFVMGGGEASPGAGTLGSEAARLLRGFPASTFAGRQVTAVNVDYRFPIARPQRGLGTWPLLIHSLHGAIVADAGHVWSRHFDWRDAKTSIGAELSADIVLGFGLPLTLTAGAARGHDGAGVAPSRITAYARIGHAF